MITLKNALFAIGFTILGAGLGTAGLAVAGHGHGGPPGGPEGHGGGFGAHLYRLYDGLDLTEAQQAQLEEIRDFARDEAEQDREDRRADGGQMVGLLKQAKPDRSAVHKLIDERAAQKTELAHEVADRFLDLHASLSDAQRAELIERMEELRARADERMEDGPPPEGAESGRRGR